VKADRLFAGFLLVAGVTIAQSQPVFEVASIRPHVDALGGPPQIAGNRLTLTGSTLRQLITYAYDLKIYQYVGGPDWANGPLETNSFDVIAQTESGVLLSEPQAKRALQMLLAERFHLKVHRETKEMPVFVLVVGKDGPKFKESSPDSNNNAQGKVTLETVTARSNRQGIDFLVRLLSSSVDRPVLDRTGLRGRYDFKLEYARDPTAANENVPSLFTAVQEQLGLKLEPQRAPIEILVIDSAERPTAN
jgi:uncharacterized protein (TIGR03435 family)